MNLPPEDTFWDAGLTEALSESEPPDLVLRAQRLLAQQAPDGERRHCEEREAPPVSERSPRPPHRPGSPSSPDQAPSRRPSQCGPTRIRSELETAACAPSPLGDRSKDPTEYRSEGQSEVPPDLDPQGALRRRQKSAYRRPRTVLTAAMILLSVAALFGVWRASRLASSPPTPNRAVTPLTGGAQRQEIVCTTVDEFLNAIGSQRTLILEADAPWILAANSVIRPHVRYLGGEDPARSVDPVFGLASFGKSLTIHDVEDLTIRSRRGRVRLLCRDRFGLVLRLQDCRRVRLEGLTMGHTADTIGTCSVGVLGAQRCTDLTLAACDLFGCGTEGLTLRGVRGLRVLRSTIRDCTTGILDLQRVPNPVFESCRFLRCKIYQHGMRLEDCGVVTFRGCRVHQMDSIEREPLMWVDAQTRVRFLSGVVSDNSIAQLAPADAAVDWSDTELARNAHGIPVIPMQKR